MSDILVEVAEAVPVEVNLPAKDNAIEMEVYYQDEVSLDTDLSLLYIKSGEKEIENYVENVSKPEINDYIETYAKPIVTEVVDNIASPVIDEYLEETVKPEISRFAAEEMSSYAEVATTQAGIATAAAVEANATSQSVDVKVAEFSEQTEASKQEFIAFAGEKTEEFEQTAQQATADSQANVEKARIWAEGEQAEVETLGGELSSMGAADLAYALANAPEDTPIDTANMFAMNIFKGEKGDKGDKGDAGKDGVDGKSVFDGYATNCITEIPQDIKLELNNGTLTLKAGSKVYVPNGAGKFDEVVISADINFTYTYAPSTNTQCMLFINNTGTGFAHSRTVATCFSGTTQPSGNYRNWYNTTENKMYSIGNNAAVDGSGFSFPIAIITQGSNGVTTSIDQVFNGFGYIGSTVFALPGIKGLIPDGRNDDGSLKNEEFTVDSVWLGQTAYDTNKATLGVVPSVEALVYVTDNDVVYDENYNKNKLVSNGNHWRGCFAGTVSVSDMKFTSLTPKLPFHAVDRNDSSWVAGQAMPSDKYIDLTLGASATTYTAPANGWVMIEKVANGAGQRLSLGVPARQRYTFNSHASGDILSQTIPVIKGESFYVAYALGGTTNFFRFIYAEGEE